MLNSPSYKVADRKVLLFKNEAICGKHLMEGARILGSDVQSGSSNCLVVIPHRQFGNNLLGTRET